MNCGARMGVPAPPANPAESVSQPRSQSLERFIPPELMAKLEATRAHGAIMGERRIMTMLFCDVKGSTAAAEKVDPEIWADVMNGIFEHMIRPIYHYEGTVPRLMGDAILAFFGAPIAHEDDPQRAVLAGLEIQRGIKAYEDQVLEKYGIGFDLRVGIHTGLVVVGAMGSDQRMEYTAVGDAINLAARMEQTARPGTVQISEETHKLVAPYFECESLGEVEVKGKAAPVKTFRPLKMKREPGHARGLEGLFSPLVGRETQVGQFQEWLSALDRGCGAFVTVIGEAGLGKSTLVAEIQKQNINAGWNWLRGNAVSYARSVSYFLWRQVIRQTLQSQESDTHGEVSAKLHEICSAQRLSDTDIPFIELILSLESEVGLEIVSGFQGKALVERISQAAKAYLCAQARSNPLVLVFDDIQWADEASLILLGALADLCRSSPILYICLARPEPIPPGSDGMGAIHEKIADKYQQIVLEPLSPEHTDLMLANLLGVAAEDLPRRFKDSIAEKAGGNPFFVEELIRSLIETGQLQPQDGHWQVANEGASVSLPNTLRGLLNARMDRLPESTRHILQTAAVIGRSFDVRVLEKLADGGNRLEEELLVLQETGLIQRDAVPTQHEYVFRHALIQDAAYDSILLKERVKLHLKAGETLEALHPGRNSDIAALLALHFYAAQDPRSIQYDRLAGEKAARYYANSESAFHFLRALEVAKRTAGQVDQVAELFPKLGQVLEFGGQYEAALKTYEEMQAFGREHGRKSTELGALMAKATIYSIYSPMHDASLSEQMLLQALEISRQIGDRAAETRLNWNLMVMYLFSKRSEQSLRHGQIALKLARESDDRELLAFVLNDLGRLYPSLGEFEKAYAAIGEARELWRSLNNLAMYVDSLGVEAQMRFNDGDHEKTIELTTAGIKISEKIGNLWGQSYQRMILSFAYFENGNAGLAIQVSRESIRLGDQAGLLASSIGERSDLGWMIGRYGDIQQGLDLAREGLRIADIRQPDWRVIALAAMVRLYSLCGDMESAQRIAGSEQIGMITIPLPRYTVLTGLANIELVLARKNTTQALKMCADLLATLERVAKVSIPEVLCRRANILLGLEQVEEAQRDLMRAAELSERMGSKGNLWYIYTRLAEIHATMGLLEEARRYRLQARSVIEQIATSLSMVGLGDKFLSLPGVQVVMK